MSLSSVGKGVHDDRGRVPREALRASGTSTRGRAARRRDTRDRGGRRSGATRRPPGPDHGRRPQLRDHRRGRVLLRHRQLRPAGQRSGADRQPAGADPRRCQRPARGHLVHRGQRRGPAQLRRHAWRRHLLLGQRQHGRARRRTRPARDPRDPDPRRQVGPARRRRLRLRHGGRAPHLRPRVDRRRLLLGRRRRRAARQRPRPDRAAADPESHRHLHDRHRHLAVDRRRSHPHLRRHHDGHWLLLGQ